MKSKTLQHGQVKLRVYMGIYTARFARTKTYICMLQMILKCTDAQRLLCSSFPSVKCQCSLQQKTKKQTKPNCQSSIVNCQLQIDSKANRNVRSTHYLPTTSLDLAGEQLESEMPLPAVMSGESGRCHRPINSADLLSSGSSLSVKVSINRRFPLSFSYVVLFYSHFEWPCPTITPNPNGTSNSNCNPSSS